MMLRILCIFCCLYLGPGNAGAQGTFNVIHENPFLINGGGGAQAIAFHEGEFHVLGRIVGPDTLTNGIYLKYSSEGSLLHSELFSSPLPGYKTDVAYWGEVARVEDGIVSPMGEWLNSLQGNLNPDSLIKISYSGEVLWKKSLAVDSTGYEVVINRGCSDYLGQGYIVHGYIVDTIGTVSYTQVRGLLTRTDLEGNILWHQRYPQVKEIWYSAALPDGSILLSGQQNLVNGNGSDIIIIKTDTEGNELWRHVFWEQEQGTGVSEYTAPFCILQDGTIAVITCNEGLEGFDDAGPWWVKRIQDNGNSYTILEDFLFDLNYDYHNKFAFQAITLINGNVAFVGQSNNPYAGPNDFNFMQATLVMLSPELDSLYTRYYNYFPGDSSSNADPRSQLHDIIELPDGRLAMTGVQPRPYTDILAPGVHMLWTLLVDSMGCLEPGCHLISGLQEQLIGLDGSMTVFPNPVSSGQALSLQFKPQSTATMPYNREATRILLYDIQGRLLFEEKIAPTGSNAGFSLNLSLPRLATGMYTLHWISEKGVWYDGEQLMVE